MGPSTMPKNTIRMTGFSTFFDVERNPTEVLINWVQGCLEEFDTCLRACIDDQRVLVVAARDADTYWSEQSQYVETWVQSNPPEDPSSGQLFFLHLGVSRSAEEFNLELCAYNEASFRCPDEQGYQPLCQPIESSLQATALNSELDLEGLCAQLQQTGCRATLSNDPGRFLCNWLYFRGLQATRHIPNVHALFVHVPCFDVMDEATQRECLLHVLRALADLPRGTPAKQGKAAQDAEVPAEAVLVPS